MAKKIHGYIRLQLPGWRRQSGAARRSRAWRPKASTSWRFCKEFNAKTKDQPA